MPIILFLRFLLAIFLLTIHLIGLMTAPTQPVVTEPIHPAIEVLPELGEYFEEVPGAFVLYDLNHDLHIRYNPERCAENFLPASTFKILNSLISLDILQELGLLS